MRDRIKTSKRDQASSLKTSRRRFKARDFGCEKLEQRLVLSYAPIGSPVNVAALTTTTQGVGSSRSVAVEPNGDYRVVWEDSFHSGLQTAMFDSNGVAIGAVQTIDPSITDTAGTVAMDAAGDFVVAWEASSGNEVVVQRFDAGGNTLGSQQIFGPERIGNQTIGSASQPAVAMDAKGDYAIAFTGYSPIFGFSLNVLLNSPTGGSGTFASVNLINVTNCGQASLAMNATGNFVVAYQTGQGSSRNTIAAQMINAAGTVTGTVQVASDTVDSQPSAAIDANGNFVVAYTDVVSDTVVTQNGTFNFTYHHYQTQLYFQRFTSLGGAIGSAVLVDGTPGGSAEAYEPSTAMDPNGDFVIAYTLGGSYLVINNSPDPTVSTTQAVANAYDSTGALAQTHLGLSNVFTTTGSGNTYQPSVALTANGQMPAAFAVGGAEFHNEFPFPGVFTQVFVNNAFTYQILSSTLPIYGGYPSTLKVQINRDPGFTGPVTLGFTDPLPTGVTYAVSPDSTASSEVRTITFTAPVNVAAGSVSTRLELLGGGFTLAPPIGIFVYPSVISGWLAPGAPGSPYSQAFRKLPLTINGAGFSSATVVQFGDPGSNIPALQVAATNVTSTSLQVVVPSNALNGFITIYRLGGQPIVSTTSIQYADGGITFAGPINVLGPFLGKPGSTVTISGYGFQKGCKVQFGDLSESDPALLVTPTSVSSDGQTITAVVGLYGITGNVRVFQPDGAKLISPDALKVYSFRSTYGFSFGNGFGLSTDLTDLSNLFGDDATHITVEAVPPFSFSTINTGIPDPFAEIYLAACNAFLKHGLCFGIVLTAARLYDNILNPDQFPLSNGALVNSPNQLEEGSGSGSLLAAIHLCAHIPIQQ